jgi:hypothetical protein
MGHVGRLIPLALELQRRGHEPILCLRDLSHAASLMRDGSVPLLQAPLWQGSQQGEPPRNYAEIMRYYGFRDEGGLANLLNAWRNLFTLTAPALIIFDHAPTALLAARGMPLARALIGTGFCSPPRTSPFPDMRWWQAPTQPPLLQSDTQVLSTANAALRRNGLAVLHQLTDLFDVDEDFICSYRELDHYPQRAGSTHYWGIGATLNTSEAPTWPSGHGARIFAYLDAQYENITPLLHGLSALAERVLVYAPHLNHDLIQSYTGPHLGFSPHPVNLEVLRDQCATGICHASHGVASAMLLAGIPLLLLPTQLEQYLLALNIHRLGAGLVAMPNTQSQDYTHTCARLIADKTFSLRAREFAAKYPLQERQNWTSRVVDRCEALLESTRR